MRPYTGNTVLPGLIPAILLLTALACTVLTLNVAHASTSDKEDVTEYQIKAICIYKLLLFTEWPEDESDESQDIIVIGIVGKDPFKDAFKPVEGKDVTLRKKKLVIKRFGSFSEKTDLKKCQLLFICASEKKNLKKILAHVKGIPILTVADTPGFLEAGGMLNLLKVKDKIRWEINQTPIKLVKLRPDAQLLRSAIRIVQIPKLPRENKKENTAAEGEMP